MVVRITVKHKLTDKEPKEYSLNFSQDVITIGRQEVNEIPLPSQNISRKHAMIVEQENDFYLVDLESAHGTILNNKPLKPKEKNLIRDGDIIKIENFELTFKIEDFTFTEENLEGTKTIARKMIEEIVKVLGSDEENPMIKVIEGEEKGQSIILFKDVREMLIGRDKKCHLRLSDRSVSGIHAKIIQDWSGEITISDLNSTNGTFVNDIMIKTNYKLNDRDYIIIGATRLIFIDPRKSYLDKFDIPTPITMGMKELQIENQVEDKDKKEEQIPSLPQEQKEKEKITLPPQIKIPLSISKFEITFLIIGGVILLMGVIWLIISLFHM